MAWSVHDIPDQTGRTVLITGATSGLGLESADALASAGASVVLAGRSIERLISAQDRIRQPTSSLVLDLASLTSVRRAAQTLADLTDHVDVLINNAGVMAPPKGLTEDGFETQMGTNHLGHHAFTGLVLPLMPFRDPKADCRVVTVSSMAHRMGDVDVSDLNYERRRYSAWQAYGQSKLANLLFAFELDRRARAAGLGLRSIAAHPGYANTNLQFAGPSMAHNPIGRWSTRLVNAVVAQSAADGALPQLFAATSPDAEGGQFYGPHGLFGTRGAPGLARAASPAYDEELAGLLWRESCALTGVDYPEPLAEASPPNSSTS